MAELELLPVRTRILTPKDDIVDAQHDFEAGEGNQCGQAGWRENGRPLLQGKHFAHVRSSPIEPSYIAASFSVWKRCKC